MRPPLYPMPSSSSDTPTTSSPSNYTSRSPPPKYRVPLVSGGRRSEERSVAPRMVRRGSDQNTSNARLAGGSVYSGREGSHGGRKEVLAGPPDDELRLFAQHCKRFYFSIEPAEDSSRFISATLAALPPAHRPAYTRVQSSLRSHAHLHHLRLRVSSFHALLSSLASSGSLAPSSRLDIGSPNAKAERKRRVEAFAQKWCSAGTEPFFRGLWAVLRVQSRGDESRGGAGDKRVVWEVDDAVFQESGGPDFMQEAVTILKGVLGFTDQALSSPPRLRRIRTIPRSYSDTRNRPIASMASQPDVSDQSNRERASSDPFEDNKKAKRPPPPPRRPSNTSGDRASEAEDRPLLATEIELEEMDEELDDDEIASEEIELNKPRFRLWVFPPHIDDQEAEELLTVMPKSIKKDRKGIVKDVRFPYSRQGRGLKSLESEEAAWQGVKVCGDEVAKVPRLESEEQEGAIRTGTGRMWTGLDARSAGWNGGRWFRFMRWWKRLFGLV